MLREGGKQNSLYGNSTTPNTSVTDLRAACRMGTESCSRNSARGNMNMANTLCKQVEQEMNQLAQEKDQQNLYSSEPLVVRGLCYIT